jgi:uncharacterized protein DUF2059
MRSVFLTLFSLICFSAVAQVDALQRDIIEYLNVKGTHKEYTETYIGVIDAVKKNFKSSNVPENEWEEIQTDKAESLDNLIFFMSFAYRKHFTQKEINTMTDFYKTEAAQRMITEGEIFTDMDTVAIDAFFESELGKKITAKQPELTKDIKEIATQWKSELFVEKMSFLVKKGYVPKQ